MTKEELARVTYTVWLVQPDGKLGARVFGRECCRGPVVVYKWSSPPSGLYVGVHVDGLKPKGKRGPYGFSTPHMPPMSTQDRLGAGACAEIRARGGTSGSALGRRSHISRRSISALA